RGARPQHVQTDAGDDGGQPPAEVVDLARPGPAEAQPGVLDGVVGLGERAEHSVGHRPQMGPVLLEAVGQPLLLLVLVHRSHALVARCHSSDPPHTTDVTRRYPMKTMKAQINTPVVSAPGVMDALHGAPVAAPILVTGGTG